MFEDLREQLKNPHFYTQKKTILSHLLLLLKKAIEREEHLGIGFSGGLDSCILARFSKKFTLYSVGLANAEDLQYARSAAQIMQWPLRTKELTMDEAELIIEKVIQLLHKNNVETNTVNVGVACVLYSVLQMAKDDGITTVLGGLGAEEIFAGYMRHVNYGEDYSPETIQHNLWEGLKHMETRDLARDEAIAKEFNIQLIAPFLDRELVTYAMHIHPSLKINSERRKIILQEVALSAGIPKEFALRKKKACQYGSKFDRALLKLAKKNRMHYRKDYVHSKTTPEKGL